MSQFIQDKQTELFNRLGVFFAFSDKQFKEQAKDGVEYCTVLGAGDCVPKQHAKEFAEQLELIHKEGREKELAEKGLDQIIEDELANYECWYTGYIDDAMPSLEAYGATREQVLTVFRTAAHRHED